MSKIIIFWFLILVSFDDLYSKPDGYLKWDITKLADALKIDESGVKLYFSDGRRISFLIERRIVAEVINGKIAPHEGTGYDLIAPDGGKWEVRSISKSGVYFCPSYMVGSGRNFEEEGFLEKLNNIDGYIISDITAFPNVPYWILKKELVHQWWQKGVLGKRSKISRNKAIKLMK